MDHLPDSVRRGLDKACDRLDGVTSGESEHDHRPSPLHDRLVALPTAPAHAPLELSPLGVGETAHSQSLLSHATSVARERRQAVDRPSIGGDHGTSSIRRLDRLAVRVG